MEEIPDQLDKMAYLLIRLPDDLADFGRMIIGAAEGYGYAVEVEDFYGSNEKLIAIKRDGRNLP